MKALPVQLFNTKTHQKEPFRPQQKDDVKLYTCGPTVYDYAHIGNLRTYVFEDLLKRVLQYKGYGVHHVMNLTDVDDKTIRGALKAGVTLDDFTQKYKDAFFQDLETLNIIPANIYPQATDHIPEMIAMIQTLIEKGIAYKGKDQSVYFSIHKFPDYGKLSHLNLDELQSGASNRIQNDEYDKDNVTDFVLWKHYDQERDGSIYWESPFGKGRPGWHLECSAMAMKYLGETLDIHMGGVDNIFPHHENEIAQSECASCKTFCPLWVHTEHLLVDGKKMSKSLGNFFTLRDLLNKGFNGVQVRYMLLQTHYKTQLNFTFKGLEASHSSLERIQNFIQRLQHAPEDVVNPANIHTLLEKAQHYFDTAICDDINISQALAALFDLIREVNAIMDQRALPKKSALLVLELLQKFDKILGVLSFESVTVIPSELQEALEKREQARKNKNWSEADRLRDLIQEKGYLIEDGPSGASLKKKPVS